MLEARRSCQEGGAEAERIIRLEYQGVHNGKGQIPVVNRLQPEKGRFRTVSYDDEALVSRKTNQAALNGNDRFLVNLYISKTVG